MSRLSTIARILGRSLPLVVLTGCPDPPGPPPEPCSGPEDPALQLSNRRGPVDLAMSPEVEVFPPPQGGVFAELDVVIEDMGLSELEYLWVAVDSVPAGEQFAYVRYFGDSIPLRCTEEDEVLEVDNLPVGFVEMYELDDLDGRAARVTGTLETLSGEFSVEYDVTLVRTEY